MIFPFILLKFPYRSTNSFNFSIITIINVNYPTSSVLFAWKSGLDPIRWTRFEIAKQIPSFFFRSKQ